MSNETLAVKIEEVREKLACVQGSKCEVYSRIVGYHRPVENWNTGKKEEFKNRFTYSMAE